MYACMYDTRGCMRAAQDPDLSHLRPKNTHGGGKRCEHQGCNTTARGSTKRCIAHGGGPRCSDPSGCGNPALGSTNRCCLHGGGKRARTAGDPDAVIAMVIATAAAITPCTDAHRLADSQFSLILRWPGRFDWPVANGPYSSPPLWPIVLRLPSAVIEHNQHEGALRT